ncbi:MAG: HesA/MoeB/ThiF family protein [Pseudomonadota bacterium]
MLSPEQTQRYLRHLVLKEVGAQGQQALLAAKVVIVGAGGLGGPVLMYLAAAGVGRIAIVDDDAVELSNLQRQAQFRAENVGAPKTEAAAAAARALNPSVDIEPITARLDDANGSEIIAGADLVIDGVDNFEARYALNRVCMAARVPLLSGAIGRFDGLIGLFAPFEGDLPCYGCFAPEPPPRDEVLNCAEEGVLGPVAGVVGTMMALEAVKRVIGIGPSLAGEILVYEGLTNASRRVRLPRDSACPHCAGLARPSSSPP